MRFRLQPATILGSPFLVICIAFLTPSAAAGSGRIAQSCDVKLADHYASKATAFMRQQSWTDALYAFQAAFDARSKCLPGSTDAVWGYWANVEMAAAFYNLRDYGDALKLLSQADSWSSSVRWTLETQRNKIAYVGAKNVADLIRSRIATAASQQPAPVTPNAPYVSLENRTTDGSSIVVGTVSVTRSSCDYFITYTPQGYALLEWYGGWEPTKGDVLVGSFETYGFHSVFDRSADNSTRVWVEDYWLSIDDAYEKLNEKCE